MAYCRKSPRSVRKLKLDANSLHQLGLIDEVIDEGAGAHEQPELVMSALKELLTTQLDELEMMGCNELLDQRYERLMKFNSQVSL